MNRGLFCLVMSWLGAAIALVAPLGFAQASDLKAFAPGSTCRANAQPDESYARIAADPSRWTCGANNRAISAPRMILRFDQRGTGPAPTEFTTRLGRFGSMRLTAIAAD